MSITDKQIEKFYNKNREPDVKYTKIYSISYKLKEIIREILTNKSF
jgi:hypothetical protein